MQTDSELIRSYSENHCEDAFTEFVGRHIDMVYAAALRETRGNAALAEEITQSVFIELARKGGRLAGHPALAGWLYTCVRRMGANFLRAEKRRMRREIESHTMSELHAADSTESNWRQIQPVLDDAMHQLNEKDRTAVVLRFFEERSLRDIALALGLNENAAHVRVHRALEKLRHLLAKRGITSTAQGLAVSLATGAVVAAPKSLAVGITASALTVSTTTSSTVGILTLITMSKLKLIAIAALVAACFVTTTLLVRHRHPPPAPSALTGSSGLAYAGYATPEATVQTECWAMSNGDSKLFLEGMTPEKRQRMQGKISANTGKTGGALKVTGFNILNKETISPDEVVLTVRLDGDSQPGVQEMRLQRLDGEWKVAEANHNRSPHP